MSRSTDYYNAIVSFIDILGFRSLILKHSADEIHRIIRLLKGHFEEKFYVLRGSGENLIDAEVVGPRSVNFSDCVVRVVPTDLSRQNSTLAWEILFLKQAQLRLAAMGVWTRGGIATGDIFHRRYHTYINSEEIFGPAMIRAYDLESGENNAIFPRIILDSSLSSKLLAETKIAIPDQDNIEIVVSPDKLIRQFEDDFYFVDYANPTWIDLNASPEKLLENARSAVKFALAGTIGARAIEKHKWTSRYLDAATAGRV